MGDEDVTEEARAALLAASEECLKRFPDAVLTAELHDNLIKVTMITDAGMFTTTVRVSLVRSEMTTWLNQVETESEQLS